MTHILYIDTSGRFSHIMLFNEEKILSVRSTTELNQHAQSINTHIKEILEETKISWKQINAVCVLNGPGSYTGLRIGLSSAKGFCYAHDLPLILFNHLDLLHLSNKKIGSNFAYILKARENEFFCKTFLNKNSENETISLLTKNEISEKISDPNQTLFTSDEDLLSEFENIQLLKVDNFAIQSIAFQHFREGKFANLMNSEPFYLKNVHINKINNL